MKVDGRAYRTIWLNADGWGVDVIDQRTLPHEFRVASLRSVGEAATAIRDMWVRGAPLIGVTAAYGVALAMREDPSDESLDAAWESLNATRPTAINLRWALDAARNRLRSIEPAKRAAAAYAHAAGIADEDVAINRAIGRNGLAVIRRIAETKAPGEPVNILTHCNAGWLATVDYGTATAPIYLAMEDGIAVHVYVDETRPRNQGASLTAWEFLHHGTPHTLIVDNAGGHLMQHGRVDMAIVGTDRTTARGDVCNKIGTYLKALAAKDNGVPFYVALPSPTIDWTVDDGVKEIPIEERSADEVEAVQGLGADGKVSRVRIAPQGSSAANPAFDVTPARFVTGLITERGIAAASREGLEALFPERAGKHSSSPCAGSSALRPLAGMTIVEFEGIGPGPLAGRMLAEQGAAVAVVVRPNKATLGNPDSRAWGDPLRRGKQVVELDLKRPEAVEEALKLIAGADALIEGNRPGVMERLGLGPAECARRNPKLVYGRMTGWGQDGPLAQVAGHDINYVALTGMLSLTERPGAAPITPPTVLGDAGGALGLAFGVVSGVLSARTTGKGCVVDAAILDIVAALGGIALWARAAGMLDGGRPSMFYDSPFYDAYRCADGRYVTVGALEPQFYALLLDKLGLAGVDAKAQYDTRQWPALKARFRELFASRPSEEWRKLLEGTDVCFAPVLSLEEAAAHPHNAARGVFRKGEGGRLEAAEAPRFEPLP